MSSPTAATPLRRPRIAAAAVATSRTLQVDRTESPLGELVIAADTATIFLVEFAARATLAAQLDSLATELGCRFGERASSLTKAAARQLKEYFDGRRREFDLPTATPGTPLQQLVWRQIGRIPYAATSSYGALARDIGRPPASRAVGGATGQNRLALLVPCHRVVGANGSLTGYAAGIERKRWLLEHELRHTTE